LFIRLAGCNLQCPHCDTEYTEGRTYRAIAEVVSMVSSSPIHDGGLVVITGGEPFRQPVAFSQLVNELCILGFHVQVETNGTLPVPKDARHLCRTYVQLDHPGGLYVVVSPKTGKVNAETVARACAYKYVLNHDDFDDMDGLPNSALRHTANPKLARPPEWWDRPVYLQPCDAQDKQTNALNVDAVLANCMRFGYTLQLQIHKHLGVE
jgi:organic radical activating enzyme